MYQHHCSQILLRPLHKQLNQLASQEPHLAILRLLCELYHLKHQQYYPQANFDACDGEAGPGQIHSGDIPLPPSIHPPLHLQLQSFCPSFHQTLFFLSYLRFHQDLFVFHFRFHHTLFLLPYHIFHQGLLFTFNPTFHKFPFLLRGSTIAST